MKAVFVQLQCLPGQTYAVAERLFEGEVASELYSTSGDYDLLMKIYIEEEVDIGKFINENVANVPGIVRSLTTLTFKGVLSGPTNALPLVGASGGYLAHCHDATAQDLGAHRHNKQREE